MPCLLLLTRTLDKDYELFHPAKQIPSRLGETVCVGSRKNGGNNSPIHVKVRAENARLGENTLQIESREMKTRTKITKMRWRVRRARVWMKPDGGSQDG